MRTFMFPRPEGAEEETTVSRTANVCRVLGAKEEDLQQYCALLKEAGFRSLMERVLPGGLFCAFSDGEMKLSVSFLTERKELRVFSEPMLVIPDFSARGDAKFPCVTLTQFCTHTSRSLWCNTASGMGYVIRLTDGRLLVIDGGFHQEPNYENDYPEFMALLRELSGEENPRIALWIITHNHRDHYGVLAQVQPEDAEIAAYMSTLPAEGVTEEACRQMMESIPSYAEKNIPAHAGDRYDFGDLILDVYYSCEENELYDPEPMHRDCNNQSLIFAVTVAGQKILFTGDGYAPAVNRAAELAGEEIRAEICQIAHHGRTSPRDDKFYQKVAPKVALWPGCYIQIDHDLQYRNSNTWIFGEDSTLTDHYVAFDGTVTLELPYLPHGVPYDSAGKYPMENMPDKP
ncbi:MAG: MBL fold metallo-hydrolase [Clostridia bacterium]|nr:MBL fold metallo-hydrolase [Clostridia bacterium]